MHRKRFVVHGSRRRRSHHTTTIHWRSLSRVWLVGSRRRRLRFSTRWVPRWWWWLLLLLRLLLGRITSCLLSSSIGIILIGVPSRIHSKRSISQKSIIIYLRRTLLLPILLPPSSSLLLLLPLIRIVVVTVVIIVKIWRGLPNKIIIHGSVIKPKRRYTVSVAATTTTTTTNCWTTIVAGGTRCCC